MVTDEERDYMYAEYAADPRMRRNIGISRRLFPLLENDQDLVELFHALLFSMPGSPVLYYGDEIGMGDNIFLGDRDGVRTPMQWTPDRNGGFSTADFAQLYLPPLMDPVYGFQAVNVEAEQRNPSSFLHWLRRLLQVRKEHPVFGTGTFEVLHADNPSVLAYLRADDDRHRAVRAQPQPLPAALRADARAARRARCRWSSPGRVPFPPIGELPYFVTLAPHGFYWFSLQAGGGGGHAVIDADRWPAAARRAPARPPRRGSAGPAPHERPIASVDIVWLDVVRDEEPLLVWALVEAHFADGGDQQYQVFIGGRGRHPRPEFLEGKDRELLADRPDRRWRARALRRARSTPTSPSTCSTWSPPTSRWSCGARSCSSTRTARWCSTRPPS